MSEAAVTGACAYCEGDRTALHAADCPVRARIAHGWSVDASEVGRALRVARAASAWADWRVRQCDAAHLAEPERALLLALGRKP